MAKIYYCGISGYVLNQTLMEQLNVKASEVQQHPFSWVYLNLGLVVLVQYVRYRIRP